MSLLAGAVLGFALTAQATVVIDFGSADYAAVNVNNARTWVFTGSGSNITSTIAFSATSPLNPASGYSGLPFYGGAVRTNLSSTTAGNSNIVNAQGPNSFDLIQLDAAAASSASSQYAAVIFFNSANFSGVGAGEMASITSTSRFIATGTNNQDTGNIFVRWVVQNSAGDFMISSQLAETFARSAVFTTINSGDLTALQWYAYEPSASMLTIGAQITPDFTDVMGIGLAGFKNDAGRVQFRLAAFSADLSVSAIPEPSTYAALIGAAALGLTILRRRRRR